MMRVVRTALGLGIDLGGSCVRAAQAGADDLLARVLTLPRVKPGVAYDADEIVSIVDVLRRRGFDVSRADVLLPRQTLRSAVVELPAASSGAPFNEIATAQIAFDRGVSADDFEVAVWHPKTEGDGAVPATVLTCDHALTVPILDGFARAGVHVGGLRAPDSGIAASLSMAGYSKTHAVMDVGWSAATLSVVAAGDVLFSRTLPGLGFGVLASKLSSRIGVDARAAGRMLAPGIRARPGIAGHAGSLLRPHGLQLAREIENSIEYVKRTWPELARRPVLAVGGGADDSDLTDFLTVSSDSVVAGIILESSSGDVPARYAAAAGAAKLCMERSAA